jgi:hypothetical protein
MPAYTYRSPRPFGDGRERQDPERRDLERDRDLDRLDPSADEPCDNCHTKSA